MITCQRHFMRDKFVLPPLTKKKRSLGGIDRSYDQARNCQDSGRQEENQSHIHLVKKTVLPGDHFAVFRLFHLSQPA